MDTYDASSIKVLHDNELFERMPWLMAETLAAEYGKDVKFVERGLQACRNAGVSEHYFIKRYLEGDKTIPKDDAVEYHARLIAGLQKPEPNFSQQPEINYESYNHQKPIRY
jgi:hypothetical protein